MNLRNIRPFLVLLSVLLAVTVPPGAAVAGTYSFTGNYEFILSNTLPKEMVVDFKYTSVATNQEVRERYVVQARQTLRFAYVCEVGPCNQAYVNVLGLDGYVACTGPLKLTGGTVALTLNDAEGNGFNAAFACHFQGDGLFQTDTQYGVYGIKKMF